MTGRRVDPLRRLGAGVEVSFRVGPGGWGTERHAVWRTDDPRRAVCRFERALREVRQLSGTDGSAWRVRTPGAPARGPDGDRAGGDATRPVASTA